MTYRLQVLHLPLSAAHILTNSVCITVTYAHLTCVNTQLMSSVSLFEVTTYPLLLLEKNVHTSFARNPRPNLREVEPNKAP